MEDHLPPSAKSYFAVTFSLHTVNTKSPGRNEVKPHSERVAAATAPAKLRLRLAARCTVILVLLASAWRLHAQAPEPAKTWSGPGTHGSVTLGYTYLYADQGRGLRLNQSGWFAKPSFNLGRGWSAFADFTNYYAQNRKGPLNSHGFTFGAQKGFFRTARIRPSLFAEAGDLRLSNVTVTNSFLFNIGGNLLIPFYKRLSLAITPGEYVMIKPPNQPIRNDFNSKIGLNFPF